MLLAALSTVSALGQANYQRGGWDNYYYRYWFTPDAPDPVTSDFEVSKVSPLPPYTRAKFNDLWQAFREQYGVRDGIFVKWRWADGWLENLGRGANSKPRIYTASFEVVSGLGPDGKPLSERIKVKREASGNSEENARLDQDLRGRTASEARYTVSTPDYSREIVLADKDTPRGIRFTTTVEVGYEPGPTNRYGISESVTTYYEVSVLPDNPVNQTRFVEALKAGSQFRVILPREFACRACDGVGRPAGSRVLGAKCRNCSGSGKVRGAEICTMKW